MKKEDAKYFKFAVGTMLNMRYQVRGAAARRQRRAPHRLHLLFHRHSALSTCR